MRLCSINGCKKIHYAKEWCFMHYYRNYKHGSPNIVLQGSRYKIFPTLKESFEAKFLKGNDSECWNWAAHTNNGYGQLTFRGKVYVASRISYEVYVAPLKNELHICHKCYNPLCVNPKHLFAGSVKDNMRDMVNKNRSAKGSRHSQAKLNESSVKEIKKLLKQNLSHSKIAELFDVKREAISKINQGTRWSHIQ